MSRHKSFRLSEDDLKLLGALARKMKRNQSAAIRAGLHALSTTHPPVILTGCAADPDCFAPTAAELRKFTEQVRSLSYYVKTDLALNPSQPLVAEKKEIAARLDGMLTPAKEVQETLTALQRIATGIQDFDVVAAKKIAQIAAASLPALQKKDPISAEAAATLVRLAAMFGLVDIPEVQCTESTTACHQTNPPPHDRASS